MSQMLHIEVPDEMLVTLHQDAAHMANEIRLTAAVKWYELGRLSQGKAAELAGLSRAEFIAALARFQVSPLQETAAEILQAARA